MNCPSVEDLLGRPSNKADLDTVHKLITGKTVMVTGAGGSIGSELCRQIASFDPAELVMIDSSEYNLYQLSRTLRGKAILCDVRDEKHIDYLFELYKPDLVFHAAAIKHVPIAEENPIEAILTNVFGTFHIARAAHRFNAKMVLISTDKAVDPSSVMGSTKRLAELICSDFDFSIVRFGNVLGSSGSVVPLFQEQINKGGPVTVTDPEMTRYFMTISEAVELVIQAAAMDNGLYILDMGVPVKIVDLARQMIRLSGKPIAIEYIGLRPGEKLTEQLCHDWEETHPTGNPSVKRVTSPIYVVHCDLDRLHRSCVERSPNVALRLLTSFVFPATISRNNISPSLPTTPAAGTHIGRSDAVTDAPLSSAG